MWNQITYLLKVLDHKETARIYIDPLHGNKHADEITATSNHGLYKLINDLRYGKYIFVVRVVVFFS